MRVLLTGGSGQIGTALLEAAGRDFHIIAPTRSQMDLRRPVTLSAAFEVCPDVVVNAGAYTAVDAAEDDPRTAFAVNCGGPGLLASVCAAHGIPIIQLSTDYVFDGFKAGAYREDDEPNPLSVYGRTKLEGEEAVRRAQPRHIILRTSWVYSPHGRNFIKAILRRALAREPLRVVDDQRGCPTAAADVARAIVAILRRLRSDGEIPWGTYHYAGAGEATWCDVARATVALAEPMLRGRVDVVPISSRDFAARARRPANSVLDCRHIVRTFDVDRVPWTQSLARVVTTIMEEMRSTAIP